MPAPETMSTESAGALEFASSKTSDDGEHVQSKDGGGDLYVGRGYLREFFHKEECLYSHHMFQCAAKFFDILKHDYGEEDPLTGRRNAKRANQNLELPDVEFQSENEKRLTFNLVFSTLKYQKFLEDLLDDCSFFSLYPEFQEDQALVLVMMCDFKQRKFQKRTPLPGEETVPFMTEIEDAFQKCKTKINAALARSRIKARVSTLDLLLPDSVRQKEKIGSNMHLCCWVNQLKTDIKTVLHTLRDEEFKKVEADAKLVGKTYMLDHQCYDLIVFASEQRQYIEDHTLVTEGHLVIQDKSSCVGPQSVRYMLNDGDDILHVNASSGLTTAHLASLTKNTDTIIYACSVQNEKQQNQALHNLERLGAKSRVKWLNDNIMQVEHSDERLKHVRVVLVTAECSKSAVANPVNFISSENEDTGILKDLSVGHDDSRLGSLVVKHNSTLKHVLRFPRVQGVVYYTRSLHESENEAVVTRAIEYVNKIQQKKEPLRICPPVIPLSDRAIELENPLNGKFLKYPPSNLMSGCFVAVIIREAEDPKEAAKDVLARAAAKGILTGVPVSEENVRGSKKQGRRKGEKRRGKNSPRRPKSSALADMPLQNPLVSNPEYFPSSSSMPNADINTLINSDGFLCKQNSPFLAYHGKESVYIHAHNLPNIHVDDSCREGDSAPSSPSRFANRLHPAHHPPKPVRPDPPHRQIIKHPHPFRF